MIRMDGFLIKTDSRPKRFLVPVQNQKRLTGTGFRGFFGGVRNGKKCEYSRLLCAFRGTAISWERELISPAMFGENTETTSVDFQGWYKSRLSKRGNVVGKGTKRREK